MVKSDNTILILNCAAHLIVGEWRKAFEMSARKGDMPNISDTNPHEECQRESIRLIFCFESPSTFSNSKELGSALSLPKVRDLRRYDECFHRCLDTILHWEELAHNAELRHYYIADLRDDDHAQQTITALRLMDAGFTGAYLYQSYLSATLWVPLLDLASDLKKAKSHRSNGNLSRLRLRLQLRQGLSEPQGRRLLKALSASDAGIAKSLKAAVNVLRSSVQDIKYGA
jgi:hypothetical protein